MFNRRNITIVLIVLAGLIATLKLTIWSDQAEKPAAVQSQSVDQRQLDAQNIYTNAQRLNNEGKMLQAKELYESLLVEYYDFAQIEQAQKELEDLNMKIIFSNAQVPEAVIHEVKSGDTLGELAKQYGTTIDLIKRSNNLKDNVIRIGQRLRIWKETFNIFVDKSQNILMLKQGDKIVKVYRVSTGENSSTPVGDFKIVSKLVDPVWFNRGVVVPPESPHNVLGSRWLGFDIPGYGIHGTIEPETIGSQVTAGCVRLRNTDVEELYTIIPLGTKVVVTD